MIGRGFGGSGTLVIDSKTHVKLAYLRLWAGNKMYQSVDFHFRASKK
jgi:hypothetical protein